jgi:hypothetical protein
VTGEKSTFNKRPETNVKRRRKSREIEIEKKRKRAPNHEYPAYAVKRARVSCPPFSRKRTMTGASIMTRKTTQMGIPKAHLK